MKQEDKELLLRDLCARLPYKVIVEFISYEGDTSPWFGELSCKDLDSFIHDVEYIEIKPYLRPMASMTEEQYENFIIMSGWDGDYEDIKIGKFSRIGYIGLDYIYDTLDWLNKNHFDYRGLIEKGLALEAPKEMYN